MKQQPTAIAADQLEPIFAAWKGALLHITDEQGEKWACAEFVFPTARGVSFVSVQSGTEEKFESSCVQTLQGRFESAERGYVFRSERGTEVLLTEFDRCDVAVVGDSITRFETWLRRNKSTWAKERARLVERVQSSAAEVAFAADLADKLPAELSLRARFFLASVTFKVKGHVDQKKSSLTDADRAKARKLIEESRAIRADARALLKRTRHFYAEVHRLAGSVLIEDSAKDRARKVLSSNLLWLPPEEVAAAEEGFDKHSFAAVLFGLRAHLRAVESKGGYPKTMGASPKHARNALVAAALDVFIESGLDTSHTNDEYSKALHGEHLKPLTNACRTLLHAAGFKGSAEKAIEEAIEKAKKRTHFMPKPEHEAWKSKEREKSIRQSRGKVPKT